jgi:hypothetical protein
MNLIENNNKRQINHSSDIFLMLLKNLRIEGAINDYINEEIIINYKNKQRLISKKTWIKYLQKTLLNKFTEVVQFKIESNDSQNEAMSFNIFMICRKFNGTFNFTKVCVDNSWKNNYIYKMQYKLIDY